ncbi:restriction endonuclease [candidate division KSB1 bacterium]|nr:restriction endonuclease [candidate division KSB1 bacterium]
MKYTTITIEGSILSADVLDEIESGAAKKQAAKDFGLESRTKIKDEIARAWADARDLWHIFQRQQQRIGDAASGTAETRRYWMLPLLGLLGYDAQVAKAEQVNNQSYAISHRDTKLDGFPIHIMGFNDDLGKRRKDGGPRLSPHALVQEYLNITEHLYALVSNGLRLRLLRDSSRLVKLSYIEFDLFGMLEEGHFADFALMYRLLHASRMPQRHDAGDESLIEQYHQDAMESGSRIREGLAKAVERSIVALANGFLQHPQNRKLRRALDSEELKDDEYYQLLLRLIYRLLFLMVIEERRLVYGDGADAHKRDIYYHWYSVSRLRALAENHSIENGHHIDLWVALKQTFQLFEKEHYSAKLGIRPLDGELFGPDRLEILGDCTLANNVLLQCLRNLSLFTNEVNGQLVRVNYAALNVEEFGSVYEGLLEYDPSVTRENGVHIFRFVKGSERSASGTHYTPDELVVPLIQHSLDYVIEEKLQAPLKVAGGKKKAAAVSALKKKQENALLSIRVCDVACGSGHILLNAARRIAQALASLRSGEDQPSPEALRPALRDVIAHCIYGVDKNPLAVELCKVSLWLEGHNPGEPLSFLDHRIKCGDAVVGLAHPQELQEGIADDMFKALPEDDKAVCKALREQNKAERKERKKRREYSRMMGRNVQNLAQAFEALSAMPEHTPAAIAAKREAYEKLMSGKNYLQLRLLASIKTAPWFMRKENAADFITDGKYREYLNGRTIQSRAAAKADAVAAERHIFHWFIEFPEVMAAGGFDCILGNPPFLGGQKISTYLDTKYLRYLHLHYIHAKGTCDLVAYFFRRNFNLIKEQGFVSLISTNTISQGDTRVGGLAEILRQNGTINHAIQSMPWPGKANVQVALVTICNGKWNGEFILNRKSVKRITSYLDDSEQLGDPYKLYVNKSKSFIGSYVLGMGFILTPKKAQRLIEQDEKNKEVLFPYLNGDDLNSRPDQSPSRWVINFFDWDVEKAKQYKEPFRIIEEEVKPEREKLRETNNTNIKRKKYWWQYGADSKTLYRTIATLEKILVVALTSKFLNFTFEPPNFVYSHATGVLALDVFKCYTIIQSNLHNEWARKLASSLETRLRYTPSDCFETFPFPLQITNNVQNLLDDIGNRYHQHRKILMLSIQLGLTKTYNQFHNVDLPVIADLQHIKDMTLADIEKQYGKSTALLWKHLEKTPETCSFAEAVKGIVKLRALHREMDEAVLAAYGWHEESKDGPAIDLRHGFYEVDYLPENDRVRYTIHPDARREVLKRLLLLNHKRHAEEVEKGLWDKKKGKDKAASQRNLGI